MPLSPQRKTRIRQALPNAPLAEEDILGPEDLNNLLHRHPGVERDHFKLWLASSTVLERILHSGVYNRTQMEMDRIREMVPKFVHNKSVPEAEAILAQFGALIVAGEPGVGKTTLARMLVWLHAEQGWHISVIDDIKEAFDIITNDDRKHLIFFDDFLGQVRLSTDLIRGTDQRFPPFLQKVRTNRNLRFILTTRDYIFRQAQSYSTRLSSPSVLATEFVLNVGSYTREARARIPYNHLYFSDMSEMHREELLEGEYFLKTIDHRNFNPRLIELLTSADYLALADKPIRVTIQTILENPQELWETPYRTQISEEGRAMMMALFFNDPSTALTTLERTFSRMVMAMGLLIFHADLPSRFRSALKELEGSVLAIQDRKVRFSNPGIRDFLLRAIQKDRFLPAALNVISEFPELQQCWGVFSPPGLRIPKPAAAIEQAWINAVARMLDHGGGAPLKMIVLIVDIYDQLNDEGLLPHLHTALKFLTSSGIEGAEVDVCSATLERLASCALPISDLGVTQDTVTIEVCEMVASYGGALSLDEMYSISSHLLEFGSNQDAVGDAVREGIKKFIDEIDESLRNIRDMSELDSFEDDLTKLMEDFSARDSRAPQEIASHRDYLAEQEDDNRDRYTARPKPTLDLVGASTDQIRSMFQGLNRR